MKKSLFMNGCEVLTIDATKENLIFLCATDDGNGMKKVSYTDFMTEFKSLAYVYITSWDENCIKEYKDFNKEIDNIITKFYSMKRV